MPVKQMMKKEPQTLFDLRLLFESASAVFYPSIRFQMSSVNSAGSSRGSPAPRQAWA